jgi:type IV secretion system protein VirD4
MKSYSLTEDYIEQFFECSKKLNYRDLTPENDRLITVNYEDLPNVEIEGFPAASDFTDNNGGAYSYDEYKELSRQKQCECRLRYYYLPTYHELVIGTTGSGKTTGCTEPQLRAISSQKNKPNLFITDTKGELFESHAKHLKEQGYRLFALNFKEPMRSDMWNPLLELYDLKVKAAEIPESYEKDLIETDLDSRIHQIAKSFIPVKNKRDPSWECGAQDLLKGIIYALLENADKKNSGFTRDMMTVRSIEYYYNALKKEFINFDGSSAVNNYFTKDLSEKTLSFMSLTLDNAPNTKRNFFGTFEGAMNDWFTGHISALTTGNTIEIEDENDAPFVIFLITRDYDKSDFTIAGLFIDAIYKKMIMRAEKSKNGRNKRATHFLLDEFGNIPEIKDFENKISTSRSRNIWFHLSIQSYMQLEIVYDKARADLIRDKCNTQSFLGSQNRETKEIFSKECGKHTIPTLSAMYNENEYSLDTVPLVPVSQLDLIKPGEMYVKRVYKPVFISSFVRSYQAENAGVYKNFDNGLKDELPCREKKFDALKYTFVPIKKDKPKDDLFDW